MSRLLTCRIKPYIQPFERRLALAELEALAGQSRNRFRLYRQQPSVHRSRRSPHRHANGKLATGKASARASASLPRRHCAKQPSTLYATASRWNRSNGLSASMWRNRFPIAAPCGTARMESIVLGKLFPQLVRSLINVAQVPQGGLIPDPMSGSVQWRWKLLSECHAIGLDINPLSVLMGQTKCGLLSADPVDRRRL